jgi:thiol-disulfide isomerase/thioredoxin
MTMQFATLTRRQCLALAGASALPHIASAGVIDWYNGVKLGAKLPDFDAQYLNGNPAADSKLTFIDFWATWCAPCREQIPHINSMYAKYKDQGLSVIGLTLETVDVAMPFLKKVSFEYPVGAGGERPLQRALGIKALPYGLFVNSEAVVIWRGQPSDLTNDTVNGLLHQQSVRKQL